ncbi:acyltransferase family protein [Chryseobacterium arachidis]|uniref:acyltransferase family protein n=1 Tax=Chryseobacterium arachidis TaxID=1416778 RepID=UPI00361D0164
MVFLIGRILIRDFEQGISFKKIIHFWKRRWFRTIPAYLVSIFLIITLSYLTHTHFQKWEVLKTIFFIQNLNHEPKSFFIESWSLSIEEWFYLTLPILLFIFHKISKVSIKINIIIIFFIVFIASNFIRLFYFQNLNIGTLTEWDNNLRKPVITRLDSILIGVLGAWIFHFKRLFFDKNKTILFVLGFIIFLFNKFLFDFFTEFNFYSCVLYFCIMPFSILMMLPQFYYLKETKLHFVNKIITKGSLISYSMYLVNLTIVSFLILNHLPFNFFIKFLLFWI